ncbi:DUF3376 domain-containing protein [Streptomyces sp. NPDC058619]|uniref:DUF3376 domain-containing protein n=1 Tax=unclassified Streptomyces TaxID=2593676 RepID=UPI003646A4CF
MPDQKSTGLCASLRRARDRAFQHVCSSTTSTDASALPCTRGESQCVPKIEYRIALVMNGGVSLAVWMGGVTHELDLLRRASRGDHSDTVPEEEREVFRLWQEVAKEAGVEVKIDIVSGTSAGGLNGLLLATGIARGSQSLRLRDLWRDVASLDELSRKRRPRRKALLDGDWFKGQVKKVLDGMLRGPESQERVTLFVTATALDGRHRDYEDDAGSAFSVRDHRRMYRFRNEPEAFRYVDKGARWELENRAIREFAEAHNDALVTAARATASYPVAFQPVSEHPLLAYRVHPDKELDMPASCVMDGGVLNNAPFTPVLDEITERRGGPAERVVMFVAPSGGVLADEAVKDRRCDDVGMGTAAWSALNYPQEVDFRSGIEDVQFRLEISGPRSRDELLCRLLEYGHDEQHRMQLAARALYAEYRRSRLLAVRKRLAVTNARVTALKAADEPPEEILREVLAREDLMWLPPTTVRSLIAPRLGEWRWGITPAERLLQNLLALLHQLLRNAREAQDSARARRISDAIPFVNDSLVKVLAINKVVRKRTHWDECPPGLCEEAIKVNKVFTDLSVPSEVGRLVGAAARCFLSAARGSDNLKHWETPEHVVAAMLLVEVLTQSFAPPARAMKKLTPEFRFLRLGPDHMGPLFNEDWSVDLGPRKLYGLRCYHFAAFLSKDWRRHDFAWGRLDAAHHLLSLLSGQLDGGETERSLHAAILQAEDLPGEGDDPIERMRTRLKQLRNMTDDEVLAHDLTAKSRRNMLLPLGRWRWLARPLAWGYQWHLKWRSRRRSRRARPRTETLATFVVLAVYIIVSLAIIGLVFGARWLIEIL